MLPCAVINIIIIIIIIQLSKTRISSVLFVERYKVEYDTRVSVFEENALMRYKSVFDPTTCIRAVRRYVITE